MLYMGYILCMIYTMHLKMEAFFIIWWLWVFRLCALCVRYFYSFWFCLDEIAKLKWVKFNGIIWEYSTTTFGSEFNFNYFMLQTTLKCGNSLIFVVICFWRAQFDLVGNAHAMRMKYFVCCCGEYMNLRFQLDIITSCVKTKWTWFLHSFVMILLMLPICLSACAKISGIRDMYLLDIRFNKYQCSGSFFTSKTFVSGYRTVFRLRSSTQKHSFLTTY